MINTDKPMSKTKLPTIAIIIGLVSFFSDVSTEMAYPLLPLFINSVLHAPVTILGLIEGFAEATASIITGFSGIISDRFQRRKTLALMGYGTTTIAKPIVALAIGWPMALLGRCLDRFGKGVRSAPKDALLADIATPQMRGRIFGFERMMDSAGAVLGPAFAILLFYIGEFSLRTVLLLTVIPSIAAVALFFLVPEHKESEKKPRHISLKGLSKQFWLFILVNTIFNIGNSSNTFLLLKANQVGLGINGSLLCYMLYNAVYSLVSYPAGIISDRLGRRNILLLGYIIFTLVYFGFAQAESRLAIWLLFIAYGFYPALTDGVSKAMAVDTTRPEMRASAIGIYSATLGLTRIPASFVGGLLWEYQSSTATFYYGAVSALLAFLLFMFLFPHQRERSASERT